MTQAFICDAIRTPFGRYGGALSPVRTDDLAAIPLRALMAAIPAWTGPPSPTSSSAAPTRPVKTTATSPAWPACWPACPWKCPAAPSTACGSSLGAVGSAARAIKSGEASLMIAGGIESMSRAPFVMPKAESAFSRSNAVYDTTIGWRFVNKLMKDKYGVDSMPETAENVATDFKIERAAQDLMAFNSQMRAVAAIKAGHLARESPRCTSRRRKAIR